MILRTPRRWWIATGILALAGIILIVTKAAGGLSIPLGVLLLFIGMAVFAAAPMRYGQGAHAPSMSLPTSPPPPPEPASPPPLAEIEAGDSSDV
jgi:drug/metabolite transporter (DMT)-like permease